jgi:hypothetical protein
VKVLAGALYKAYVAWCEGAAQQPATQTAFGLAMADRYTKKPSNGYPWYLGVRLITDREIRERDERDVAVEEVPSWDA